MIKRFVRCFVFIFLMVFLFLTLVSNAWPADKTFNLTINSTEVIIKLPNDLLPPMENAIYKSEKCFNLIVCRKQFYFADSPFLLDYVDFIYKNNAEMIALVWIKPGNIYVAWKYVDGVPILSTIPEIIKLIKDTEKPQESSFKPFDPFKPGSPRFGGGADGYWLVDFTYEGELNPDVFTTWKVIKTEFDPKGIVWINWQNPNPNSPIKVIVGQLLIDGTLLRYRYFKNGQPYMFSLDSEKNKYVQYRFTDEEQNKCMGCHQNEVKKFERHLKTI